MSEWKKIHSVADKLEPEMRLAFLDAVQQFKKKYDLDALIKALEAGQIGQLEILLDSLDDEFKKLAKTINKGIEQGGNVAASYLSKRLGTTIVFDLTNPLAIDWAEKHAGKLITQVAGETREAIRGIIVKAVKEGLPPRESARLIRQHIGLTTRQSVALSNYRNRVLADDSLKKKIIG